MAPPARPAAHPGTEAAAHLQPPARPPPPFKNLRLTCLSCGNMCYLKYISTYFCLIVVPPLEGQFQEGKDNEVSFTVSLVSKTSGWHVAGAEERVVEWYWMNPTELTTPLRPHPSRTGPAAGPHSGSVARPPPLATCLLEALSPFLLLEEVSISPPHSVEISGSVIRNQIWPHNLCITAEAQGDWREGLSLAHSTRPLLPVALSQNTSCHR